MAEFSNIAPLLSHSRMKLAAILHEGLLLLSSLLSVLGSWDIVLVVARAIVRFCFS